MQCFCNCLNTIWLWFFQGSRFKRTAIVIKEKNSMQVAGLSVKITKEEDSSGQCCTFLCFMTGYSGRTFWQLHPIWYIHEFSHSMSGDILLNLSSIFCFGLLSRLKTTTYRPKSHLTTSWRPLMWAHTWQWPLWLYEKQAGQCLLSSHVTKQAFCSTIFNTRQLVICIQVSTLLSVVTVLYRCMFRRFEGWG